MTLEERRERSRTASRKFAASEKGRTAQRAYVNQPEIRARRNAQAVRKAGLRRAFTSRWKLAAGCFDCGYNAAPEALDFDHIGEKSFSLNRVTTRGWPAILAEIEKCVVRCANCHRIKTRKERTCPSR